ncbi:MAG: bifunctional demethylmenaquinone methyltransferase/2-methoxy-6-polyprenyl-1,4-benzoquinol methylase UbiE [Gammaproteobacteria bacterium]|nr:bifunctional demethylmenaquinone methyltransferase/2-methoxy-6-polyprenyl-1,4-benzoquinol methylase UbiE [Gammaproteobacteria bacterium]
MTGDPVTHFGYEQVTPAEKTARVKKVFESVADRYDVMNDLMSLGLHRWWKRFAVSIASARSGQRVLDLAGGSGDVARLLAPSIGANGELVLADINYRMLEVGRDRLINAGVVDNVRILQANAESLPFQDRRFDLITMAFGLRNVTAKDRALSEIYRVLRPGGKALILEFSQVQNPLLARVYDAYSLKVLPKLGAWIANDAASYRYLAESIRMHPPQHELLGMLTSAGFERCRFHNLMAGIVALHVGYRL